MSRLFSGGLQGGLNSVNSNNRRNDEHVRSAIDSVQELLFDPQASEKIFPPVLDHIAKITDSHYGVVIVPDFSHQKDNSLLGEQEFNAIFINSDESFINEYVVSKWLNQKIMPNRPTYFNSPIPNSYKKFLTHSTQVSAICLLPVVSRNQLQAFCILAKTKGGYDGRMMHRLMPLLGSVVCALQSAESVKGDFLGLDKKIADNRYLSSLMASSPIAMIVVAPDNQILLSNPAAQDMFCAEKGFFSSISLGAPTLASRNIQTLFPDYDALFKWSNQHSRYGNEEPLTSPNVWENQTAHRTDGTKFIVNLSFFRYTHGAQRFTTLQIQDITALREKAEEYQQASQQLNALTHLVPVGIIRVDSNWNCVYANDRWHDFAGLIFEETEGQQWINAIHSDEVKFVLEELRESLSLGLDFQKEIRLVSPLGAVRWVEFNTRVLFDENGCIDGFLGTFADITERLQHHEKLRQIAEYDSLTGLVNRNLFQDRLQQAFYISEREDSPVSVIFMDLDGFKDINDTLGHDVGDVLLQQVAQKLINTLRRNDTVARFGGDEFVIMLGHSEDDNDPEAVAQKVIDAIAQPFTIGNNEVFVTTSLGIAQDTCNNSSPEQLLKQADTALYLAKGEGKNTYRVFNKELDEQSKVRIELANLLRSALKKNRYRLHFQPIARVEDKKIIGYEALLRFVDKDNRLIEPDSFIPILEETSMIVEVGKWVIEESCRQVRQWLNEGIFTKDHFLSFNVSAKQLLEDSTVETIRNACQNYGVDPRLLVMEMTETVIISKPQKVESVLKAIKSIGLRLALDDFGTGYSSLSYLQKYPFDHIKIDKSFIDDLENDSNDAKITRSIIALARSLGLKVTAEGVEDVSAWNKLKEFGADYFQGYYLGKPLDEDNLLIDDSKPQDVVTPIRKNLNS